MSNLYVRDVVWVFGHVGGDANILCEFDELADNELFGAPWSEANVTSYVSLTRK